MSLFRFALLAAAIFPAAAASAQMRSDRRPPVVVPAPIRLPPPPRAPGDYPEFHDKLVRIYFDFDSASLSPTAERIVDLAAERALRCNYLDIAVAGHVDTATARSRALPLSRRMASAVRRALIARGLDPKRIDSDGFGSTRPAIVTGRGVREPLNRRIEMAIRCPGNPPGPVFRPPAG